MPPEPKGTTADSEFLSQFAGQTVFTSGGQAFEVRAVKSGSITTYRLFPVDGGRQLSGNQMQGLTFVDNLSRVVRIGAAAGGGDYPVSTGSISEAALGRFLGVSDSTGTSAPSFASTQAAQSQAEQAARDALTQQHENDLAILEQELENSTGLQAQNIQAQIDLENLRHENDLAELALQFENQLKTTLIGEIGATTRTLIQEKGQERARQTELAGRDIFKFTANLRGRAAGTAPTPVDVFKQQGAEFVNRPLPQVDPNAPLSELQAGLSALQKLEAPQGQGIFGLAHSGVIQMEQGADGKFGQKQAFFVGENPDGTINDTTEILITGGGRTEVIPISGGAQGGLDIPNLNLGGFPDLLSFLRQSTGVGGFTATPGLGGRTQSVGDVLLRSQASALGAFQRGTGSLLQARGDGGAQGPVFIVDERGQLRAFTSASAFSGSGFERGDISFLQPNQLARFDRGAAISEPFTLPSPNFAPEFQAFGQPLNTRQGFLDLAAINPDFSREDAIALSNRIGFLPAPAKIARQIGIGGANLDDQEIQGLLSLYGLANVDLNTFFRQIEAATPTGRLGRPQRIGFQGARL